MWELSSLTLLRADEFMALMGYTEDYRGFVETFQCWCIFLNGPVGQPVIELVVPTGGELVRFNKGAGGTSPLRTGDGRPRRLTEGICGPRYSDDRASSR